MPVRIILQQLAKSVHVKLLSQQFGTLRPYPFEKFYWRIEYGCIGIQGVKNTRFAVCAVAMRLKIEYLVVKNLNPAFNCMAAIFAAIKNH